MNDKEINKKNYMRKYEKNNDEEIYITKSGKIKNWIKKNELEDLIKKNELLEIKFRASIIKNGKINIMLFKTENIKSNGFCGYTCLKKCLVGLDLDDDDKYKLQDYKYFLEVIKNKNIILISNSFNLITSKITIAKEQGTIKKNIIDRKGRTDIIICSKLENKYIEPYILYKPEDKKDEIEYKYIIYDAIDKHFDILKDNKIDLEDNIFISPSNNIIKDDLLIFTPFALNMNYMIY